MARYILVFETDQAFASEEIRTEDANVAVQGVPADVRLLAVVDGDDAPVEPPSITMLINERSIGKSRAVVAGLRLIADCLESPDELDDTYQEFTPKEDDD